MIRNLSLYPAELRGLGSFPRVSAPARQPLRGTERSQRAHRGTSAAQFQAHGAFARHIIRDYAETAEICQSSRLFRENSSRFATVTGGGA